MLTYNSLWMQKSIVLLLCRHIVRGLPFPEQIIKVYWALLFATLTAVEVTCFTDCSPVSLYWQVVPEPGKTSILFSSLLLRTSKAHVEVLQDHVLNHKRSSSRWWQ